MSTIVRKPQNKVKPWVVRYQVKGKQREKGFSTKQEARAFQTDNDHAIRYGTYVDPKLGNNNFGDAVEAYIRRRPIKPRSLESYWGVWRKHIKPVFGDWTLADVADDRDGVADFLTQTVSHLNINARRMCRSIITGVCDEAIQAKKLTGHNLAGIELAPGVSTAKYTEFVPATNAQVKILADAVGVAVYLMYDAGLRAEEALGVHREHFRVVRGVKILRVSQQASRDGHRFMELKKRNSTAQYRDVPCTDRLWDMVKDLPEGPVCPGNGRMYAQYETKRQAFQRAAKRAGLPATYTPHSLRHQYGSELLRAGVPAADVAGWLGHKSIDTLYKAYRSELDGAKADALAVLNRLRIA